MLNESSRLSDFPSLAEKVYVNTAAEGIPPQAVLDALHQYGQDKLLGMDGRKLHEAQWRGLREQTAKAFGLSADEIGICSCSSEAFNLARLAVSFQPGDEVIINDLDFPAGATPWLHANCPAEARVWRNRDGALRVEDLLSLLSPRTRVVSVSLVSFFNGFKLPLREVVETVRANSDALIVVDVTQALGHVTLDLDDVDLIISSTHKWILASHGGGLVGVPKRRADEWTVPAGGWFNLANAFEADRFDKVVVKRGAESFMVGMPNYAAVYAVRAGLEYVMNVGIEAIESYTTELAQTCFEEIKQLPVQMLTPDEPASLAGIIAFRHDKGELIAERLREQNIHLMSQAGRLRISIHGYNTADDIQKLVSSMKDILRDV